MVQDNVKMCPRCSGALRQILTYQDIVYVCNDCNTVIKVTGIGTSERELECEVIV